jgi:methylated-DNA-protein-cysteine methyltransferase related protein
MTSFTEKALQIIQSIPSGKVMTYGQVASEAGSPRAARQVVRILHSMSNKYNLPWHRVINSKGEIGFKDEEMFYTQKTLLESEGVEFVEEKKILISRFLWQTDMTDFNQ